MAKKKDNNKEWSEATFEEKLDAIYLHKFRPILIKKNQEYGDAALNPVDFMRVNPQSYKIIQERMNEKLNRLASLSSTKPESPEQERDIQAAMEDSIMDFSGYWFLMQIEIQNVRDQFKESMKFND